MLLKVVVGLIVIVCIVKWIIRGLTALGIAIAAGLSVVLPVILWSLAGLASLAVAGVVLWAAVVFVPWSSFTRRLRPQLTSDLDLPISSRSAAPPVGVSGRASIEPSETSAAGAGPAEAQSAESELGEANRGMDRRTAGARAHSAPGRAASPPPVVQNNSELPPLGDAVNVRADSSAEEDHGVAVEGPGGDVLRSETNGATYATELSGVAWPSSREPSFDLAGPVENVAADVSRFMLFQRCGAAVVGNDNHLLIAWSIRIEKPRMDFGALFAKAEVKIWMRALREGSADEPQLRAAAAKAMCAGHGVFLEPAVIDVEDQLAPATVKTLPELWDLLGDMVVFWRCNTAVKGNGNTVPVEIRHLYRDAEIDSAQLFSENPALAQLLLDSVANGSIDRWTTQLTGVLDQTLRSSPALNELPADRVLQFTSLERPTRITDADHVSIGEGNTSKTTVDLDLSKNLRSGSAAELNHAVAYVEQAQRAEARAARYRRIEEATHSSRANEPLSGVRLDKAIQHAEEALRAAREGRHSPRRFDTEADYTSVDRSPERDNIDDFHLPTTDFGGFG